MFQQKELPCLLILCDGKQNKLCPRSIGCLRCAGTSGDDLVQPLVRAWPARPQDFVRLGFEHPQDWGLQHLCG